MSRRWVLCGGALLLLAATTAPQGRTVLDGFESLTPWSAAPSDGVRLSIAQMQGVEGRAMRLDFDFQGGAGYAVARRSLDVTLPEDFELSFRVRGDSPVNNFEIKLLDQTGQNVWWVNRRNFEFPREWTALRLKKRHFEFAWGPDRERRLQRVSALELAVTAGSGGKGWIAIDELTLTAREPARPDARPPDVRASSGGRADAAYDGDLRTIWRAPPATRWVSLDFRQPREYGGLVIDWEEGRFARRYAIQTSDDGVAWNTVREVARSDGGRDYSYLPETESRHLRLLFAEASSPDGYGIRDMQVKPLEFSASANAFFQAIARDAPRGRYPRGFSGEQSYWTVVGVDGDVEEGLFSEDGALEAGTGAFSVEPFLYADGQLVSWSDVELRQALEEGDLPIPTVTWNRGPLSLEVTVLAFGEPGASSLHARYRVRNRDPLRREITLFLAVRPFQVNPPTQFLNSPGGVSPMAELSWERGAVSVNGRRRVYPLCGTPRFGAVAFDEGAITEYLARGQLPAAASVRDSFGYASGALAFGFDLTAGGEGEAALEIPLHGGEPREATDASCGELSERRLAAETSAWRARVDRVKFALPGPARHLAETLRANLAYVLVNRDGASIQPGSRAYERSWIRDGALTSSAMLRLGHAKAVRGFVEWFASHQFPDGKVPCCVDRRGADPVPENDSHGELVFAIAEYFRFTRDRAFLDRMWPHVERAVAYLDRLRQQRRTEEFRHGEKLLFFGLLPESISHEGYSAKPMHSYWDDFFALKGFKDAAELAEALGNEPARARYATMRDEFRRDLLASLARARERHRIRYIPGAAELGDFDPTSTTIAIDPGGELLHLPRDAVEATFERYFAEFRERKRRSTWDAYTPYELRNVGAFVRLGWRARAQELLQFFLAHRRPEGWRQWAEVVGREERSPRFIGDMPHTWVGSDFIRAVLDFFAYERPEDHALVLGAGIPGSWLAGGEEVSVRSLATTRGALSFSLEQDAGAVRYRVEGGIAPPPGGIVLTWPLEGRPRRATVNGRPGSVRGGEVVIRDLPASVIVHP